MTELQSVTIQLTADQVFDQGVRAVSMLQQICHRISRPGFVVLQTVADLWVMPDHPRGPRFMAQAKHLFTGMAQGAMADVMEQSSSVKQPPVPLQVGCQWQHPLKRTACQMKDPQRVSESTGFSAVKGEVGRAQLADATQALERRCVHQVHHHSLGWGMAVQANASVQRVVIGPLTHASV